MGEYYPVAWIMSRHLDVALLISDFSKSLLGDHRLYHVVGLRL